MAKMLGSKMMSSGEKADLIDQDVVGAPGDRALQQACRPDLLGERHHHDGGAVAAHGLGMIDEGGLALLGRNRVHHRLALQVFELTSITENFERSTITGTQAMSRARPRSG